MQILLNLQIVIICCKHIEIWDPMLHTPSFIISENVLIKHKLHTFQILSEHMVSLSLQFPAYIGVSLQSHTQGNMSRTLHLL